MPMPVVAEPHEHRELDPVEQLVGERALQLRGGRDLAGQVALELLVVAGDDLLDELVVQAVFLVGDVGRERLGVVAAVGLVLEPLVGEHVGDAVEVLLLAERQLEGHEAGAEPRLQLVEDAVEVGPLLVLLVDEHHPWHAGGDALRQAGSVPTSTPSTALTTTTARSATDRAASTSPAKSA